MTVVEIVAALDGLAALMKLVENAIAAGKERGEWTAEESAAFDASLAELKNKPWWQIQDTDKPTG